MPISIESAVPVTTAVPALDRPAEKDLLPTPSSPRGTESGSRPLVTARPVTRAITTNPARPAPGRGTAAGGFFDIHCHILPGLDEGAANLEEALRMISVAEADGVAGIVATPHVMRGVYDNSRQAIGHAAAALRASRGDYPIYPGAEVRINKDLIDRIDREGLPLINGKSHLLLELPACGVPPVGVLESIVKNLLAQGVIPLFAHPERNMVLRRNLCLVARLLRRGALFQVTAMSITNHLGGEVRRAAFEMIRCGLAHVVASDAHDAQKRPPVLSGAFEAVRREFGVRRAEDLFREMPLKIIDGENLS